MTQLYEVGGMKLLVRSASNSILKKHPDIFDNMFDRLLKTSQKGRSSDKFWKDRLVNPIER